MGRNINQIIENLSPERQQRVVARYEELRQEVESVRALRRTVNKPVAAHPARTLRITKSKADMP